MQRAIKIVHHGKFVKTILKVRLLLDPWYLFILDRQPNKCDIQEEQVLDTDYNVVVVL